MTARPRKRNARVIVRCIYCGIDRQAGGNVKHGSACSQCSRVFPKKHPRAVCLVAAARIERWFMHDRLARLG